MNCPNCGHPETARVKVCPACHQAYASQDLLALRRLEFLIAETASWEGAQEYLAPYQERLAALRSRLIHRQPEVEEPEPAVQVEPPAEPEPPPAPVEAAPPAALLQEPAPAAVASIPAQKPSPAAGQILPPLPVEEPVEKVPFDQWLLSERNIKIALYTGALLLVIAGAIFVGVNWMRIPGPARFAITLLVTGLTVLGGYLLFQRPAMRPGGVAVLAVACGFLALNFVVLQIYVLGPAGLRNELMWLIASPLCLIPYLALAVWTRSDLFVYIGLGAVASTVAAALTVAGAPLAAYLLAATLLVTALLPLAWRLRTTELAEFTYRPLLYVTQGSMALALLASLVYWLVATDCSRCVGGSPWLAIAGLAFGVLFYAATEWRHRVLVARWASTGLFTLVATTVLVQARADQTLAALLLMVLALIQLLVGHRLQTRAGNLETGLPLYTSAALVALVVTALSTADQASLVKVLLADVVLLGVAARLFGWPPLIYAAVWLFMLPVYLILDLNVPWLVNQGLLMGALGLINAGIGVVLVRRRRGMGWPFLSAAAVLSVAAVALTWEQPAVASLVLVALVLIYVAAAEWLRWPWLMVPVCAAVWTLMVSVYLLLDLNVPRLVNQGLLLGILGLIYATAGYGLARRARRLTWPFLSAAAGLSVAIIPLVWGVPAVAGPVLVVLAVLYALAAVWLGWPWLVSPGLLALNLALLAANLGLFRPLGPTDAPLVISGALLGWALVGGGLGLKRAGFVRWHWPLYVVGGMDAALALIAGLVAGGWLAVGLAAATASFLFALAWWERDAFPSVAISPLSGAAIGTVCAGFLFLLDALGGPQLIAMWPAYTAGLCALFVVLGWLLRDEPLATLYGTPFRYAGLALMTAPAVGAAVTLDWGLVAVTLAVVAITYAGEAAVRRILYLAYLGLGVMVLAIWAALAALNVSEPQAYAALLGLALLGTGWNERRLRATHAYLWPTVAGLLVLLGSAFIQSLGDRGELYALVLLIESVAAVAWGIRSRTRCCCQVGGLALLLNAVVQLGPAFLEFSRWIQIGTTGALLLGGGLLGLLKRDQILQMRRQFTDEWRQWSP